MFLAATNTVGSCNSGPVDGSGGAQGTGGSAVAGESSVGGFWATTGGQDQTGGQTTSGGNVAATGGKATGGVKATGGTKATGGSKAVTGGTPGTGGTTSMTPEQTACTNIAKLCAPKTYASCISDVAAIESLNKYASIDLNCPIKATTKTAIQACISVGALCK